MGEVIKVVVLHVNMSGRMLNLSFLVLNGFNVFGAKYKPLHSSLNHVTARTLSNTLHKINQNGLKI